MKIYSSFKQIQQDLKEHKTTCKQLVEYYLQNIEKNQHLNAYLEVYEEEAKRTAESIDQKLVEQGYDPLTFIKGQQQIPQ